MNADLMKYWPDPIASGSISVLSDTPTRAKPKPPIGFPPAKKDAPCPPKKKGK